MTQNTDTVTFRGDQVDVEWEYEGDGIIVWCFVGCDTCQQTPENDITEREIGGVYDQLWALLQGMWDGAGDE